MFTINKYLILFIFYLYIKYIFSLNKYDYNSIIIVVVNNYNLATIYIYSLFILWLLTYKYITF